MTLCVAAAVSIVLGTKGISTGHCTENTFGRGPRAFREQTDLKLSDDGTTLKIGWRDFNSMFVMSMTCLGVLFRLLGLFPLV